MARPTMRWQDRYQGPEQKPQDNTRGHMSDFQRWVVEASIAHQRAVNKALQYGAEDSDGRNRVRKEVSDLTIAFAEHLHKLETMCREKGFDAVFDPSRPKKT